MKEWSSYYESCLARLLPSTIKLGPNFSFHMCLLAVEAEEVEEVEVGHRWWALVAVKSQRMAE